MSYDAPKKGRHRDEKTLLGVLCWGVLVFVQAACPYDANCLSNPYGAGSPYKADGLMNPYSDNGSPYSNKSWTNPYATDAPKLYDSQGNYRGRLSANPYDADSTFALATAPDCGGVLQRIGFAGFVECRKAVDKAYL